jgi:hypothetical protein
MNIGGKIARILGGVVVVAVATLTATGITRVTCLTRNFSRRSCLILRPMGARRLRNVGSKARSVM